MKLQDAWIELLSEGESDTELAKKRMLQVLDESTAFLQEHHYSGAEGIVIMCAMAANLGFYMNDKAIAVALELLRSAFETGQHQGQKEKQKKRHLERSSRN